MIKTQKKQNNSRLKIILSCTTIYYEDSVNDMPWIKREREETNANRQGGQGAEGDKDRLTNDGRADRQRDRQTDRQRHRERQRQRERQRIKEKAET